MLLKYLYAMRNYLQAVSEENKEWSDEGKEFGQTLTIW